MKVFQINCVYKEGSTGKIVQDLTSYMKSIGHKVCVAFGAGRTIADTRNLEYKFTLTFESHLHTFFTKMGLSLYYGGMWFSTSRLIKIINREKPDIVHIHCPNAATVNIYRLLRFLGKERIPTIVTHHAEFFYTGSCGYSFSCNNWQNLECRGCKNVYSATFSKTFNNAHRAWLKMHDAFSCFDKDKLYFTAVSSWVKERSMLSPIVNEYPCVVVKNGVETSIFKYCLNRNYVEERINMCKEQIVFHSTASFQPTNRTHIKGGWFVVEMARRMPNVTFVVAAITYDKNAKLPPNVFVWGQTKNQNELAILYSTANVTLVPSKKETFSMICAESLCCGTPVVGFLSGGPETISLPIYSSFVEYADVEALFVALKEMLNQKWDKETIAKEGYLSYNKESVASQYLQLYSQMIN